MAANKGRPRPYAWRLYTKRKRKRVHPPEWPFRRKGVVFDTSHIPWITWPTIQATPDQTDFRLAKAHGIGPLSSNNGKLDDSS